MAEKRLPTWQVAMSILASFFGVQSRKNFHRDISHGNFLQFFLIALLMAAILHLSIFGVVKFVLRDVEHQGGRKPVYEKHSATRLIEQTRQ